MKIIDSHVYVGENLYGLSQDENTILKSMDESGIDQAADLGGVFHGRGHMHIRHSGGEFDESMLHIGQVPFYQIRHTAGNGRTKAKQSVSGDPPARCSRARCRGGTGRPLRIS